MILLMAVGLASANLSTQNMVKVREMAMIVCPLDDPEMVQSSARRLNFTRSETYMLNSMCLLYSLGRMHGARQASDILTSPRE